MCAAVFHGTILIKGSESSDYRMIMNLLVASFEAFTKQRNGNQQVDSNQCDGNLNLPFIVLQKASGGIHIPPAFLPPRKGLAANRDEVQSIIYLEPEWSSGTFRKGGRYSDCVLKCSVFTVEKRRGSFTLVAQETFKERDEVLPGQIRRTPSATIPYKAVEKWIEPCVTLK